MDDVIALSSDDSDVEILGSYGEYTTKTDPLPLSEVRIDIEAVNLNIPPRFIDLTDSRWAFPELKLRKRQNSTGISVIDLTKSEATETKQETENLPPHDGSLLEKETLTKPNILINRDFNIAENSLRDSNINTPQHDCGAKIPKQRCLDSPPQHLDENHTAHTSNGTPVVKLTRLSFLETHMMELKRSGCSVHLTKDSSQVSLCFKQQNNDTEAKECICNLRTAVVSDGSHEGPSVVQCPPWAEKSAPEQQRNCLEPASAQLQDKESQHLQTPTDSPATLKEHNTSGIQTNGFHSFDHTLSPTFAFSSEDKAQSEALASNIEQLELDKASRQIYASDYPSPYSPATGLNSCKLFEPDLLSHTSPEAHKHESQVDPPPSFEHTQAENTPEWQLETETCEDGLAPDSPVSLVWQGQSDEEDMDKKSRYDTDFRAVSRADRQIVSSNALRKAMARPTQAVINEDDQSFSSELLCRQSLSLVYSTIEENFPEATLQFLSDLLQPGYHPPKDITNHLLRGILLDPACPHLLSVQAFNLLMRTQRHHRASRSTVPWDWDLLTSVLSDQDSTRKHRCEVVRMFLEYTVQTLEDDFQARCSSTTLHHSVAKTVLSCDLHFSRVRDVIQWLFAAIMKSTERGESQESIRERNEQTRIVSILQRMLSLALEVDRSPALNSAKLSQELFHMLLSHMPLRAHRMLLLESLKSELLRCKLLEHLLDYACPKKIPLPMSLSLLLHFLKNCTVAPDPTDGTERWQKWEELIQLLWMLLLSYNRAMKGYLCSSNTEQRGKTGTSVYKPDDVLSKPAVREAVEAFLSRSQADLGQPLPLHVEESLTYLQDHLLDACQC
ncbi:uncharacterized protein simc1 [Melanotaenia boesemani]|uniref:uncharacterized protein simc1 n=1 Tax=Melanotaenia boesemani TaxID=1250792 RepID=UPI001C03C467|nr:uncharacterized protein simc1 [Melanotaenia boesemani]